MNLKEALERVKMIFAETNIDGIVSAKFTEAKLVDGTVVYTKDEELTEGAILYVKTEEGEDIFAPEGVHQLEDEKTLVTVGANGEITKIETTEETEMKEHTDKKKKEKMETEVVVEIDPEVLPELIKVLDMISTEMKKMKTEFSELQERFNKVADQPAAGRIKSTFAKERDAKASSLDHKLELLAQMRRGKK